MSKRIEIDLKRYLREEVRISIIFTHPEAFMRRIEPKIYYFRDISSKDKIFELFLKPETRKFELELEFAAEQFDFVPKSKHLELFMSHLTHDRIMVAGPDNQIFAEFEGRVIGRLSLKGPVKSIVQTHQVMCL